jgi:hypothetical protein
MAMSVETKPITRENIRRPKTGSIRESHSTPPQESVEIMLLQNRVVGNVLVKKICVSLQKNFGLHYNLVKMRLIASVWPQTANTPSR